MAFQPAILAPVPAVARFVTFAPRPGGDPGEAMRRLGQQPHDPRIVVGLGMPLFAALGARLEGMRAFPGDLAQFPSTQAALWLGWSDADRGVAFDAGRTFAATLGDAFTVVEEVDAFVYRGGRDLSGFEDGTENPKGPAALAAAIFAGRGDGRDGGSFVAVQRWVHDLEAAEAMTVEARENAVGRRRGSNEEMAMRPPRPT